MYSIIYMVINMRKKFDLDLDLILKMINEENKLLKDIYQYYGCSRGQLYRFLKKHNLNFKNNVNARKKQSEMMKIKNPTKGRKRTAKEMEGIIKSNKERAIAYWNVKYKEGITYNQYAKICRACMPKNVKEQVKSIDYEIDHIFSLKDCWKYKIHPYYASCEKNLQILTQKQNKEKGSKSPYGINEFMSIVGVQRLSKAQFDWKQVE